MALGGGASLEGPGVPCWQGESSTPAGSRSQVEAAGEPWCGRRGGGTGARWWVCRKGTAAPGEHLSSRAALTLPFTASSISRCRRPASFPGPPPVQALSVVCLCGLAAELPVGLPGLGPGAQNGAQVFSRESCFFGNLLPDLESALWRPALSEMGLALALPPGASPYLTSQRPVSSFSPAGPQPRLEPTLNPSGPPPSAPETAG